MNRKKFETLLFTEMDKAEIDACDWTISNFDNIWQAIEQYTTQQRINELERLMNTAIPMDTFWPTFENRIKELNETLTK